MIIPAPNDIAFNLFGLPIYWYGIIMAIAIFVAIIFSNSIFNKLNSDLKKDLIIEYAPLIIIMGILGARFYYCSLNIHYYIHNIIEILDIREGGLSIHGAIIGGIIAILIAAKKQKTSPLKILDPLSCGTILGQAIGRWGNYFNSEAFGLPVSSQKWGLYIPLSQRPEEYIQYTLFHPTFLYESILNFFAALILLLIANRLGKKYTGATFFSYLVIYSTIRFFIEQIRIDSALNLGNIPIAIIISIILFIIGSIGLTLCLKNNRQ